MSALPTLPSEGLQALWEKDFKDYASVFQRLSECNNKIELGNGLYFEYNDKPYSGFVILDERDPDDFEPVCPVNGCNEYTAVGHECSRHGCIINDEWTEDLIKAMCVSLFTDREIPFGCSEEVNGLNIFQSVQQEYFLDSDRQIYITIDKKQPKTLIFTKCDGSDCIRKCSKIDCYRVGSKKCGDAYYCTAYSCRTDASCSEDTSARVMMAFIKLHWQANGDIPFGEDQTLSWRKMMEMLRKNGPFTIRFVDGEITLYLRQNRLSYTKPRDKNETKNNHKGHRFICSHPFCFKRLAKLIPRFPSTKDYIFCPVHRELFTRLAKQNSI